MKAAGSVFPTVALWLSLSGIAHAIPIEVNFEADATGAVANGFAPAGIAGLTLFDTVGNDLQIGDFGAQSDGQALAVGLDQDGSALLLLFAEAVDFLSLDFGNDEPSTTNDGDLAWLSLFLGAGNLIAEVSLELNRDDVLNQTILFGEIGGSILFDRAEFAFTNAGGSRFSGGGSANVGTTEIIDNIVFNAAGTAEPPDPPVSVPVPSTLWLLVSAVLAHCLVASQQHQRGL